MTDERFVYRTAEVARRARDCNALHLTLDAREAERVT
jgi:hypothetical protein